MILQYSIINLQVNKNSATVIAEFDKDFCLFNQSQQK